MDEALLIEEIDHYEALLRIQRRNLRTLELQAARHGPFDVPLPIQAALDELRAEVVRIERTLLALRAQLDAARGMIRAEHPTVHGQITVLAAADLAATARFYEGTIGLPVVLERADCRLYRVGAGAYLAFCQAAGDAAATLEWPIVVILSEDIDGWHAHLTARGASVEGAGHVVEQYHQDRFFIRDPNGYRIEIRRMNDER